jgi:hypothetical protein
MISDFDSAPCHVKGCDHRVATEQVYEKRCNRRRLLSILSPRKTLLLAKRLAKRHAGKFL